jgi:ferredoxin-NADP reductase
VLRAARALTTPLLPDDYIELINPMWSTRELRGQIVRLRPETHDTSTVVVRPSFPWPGHRPGQYLRIGAEINGVRHFRAYTITSDPDHPDGLISVTVKCVEGGGMSPYFARNALPGSLVLLGEVEGTFALPEPPPQRSLFVSAGSGITPIMSLLRSLDRRNAVGDVVHLYWMRTERDFIFGDMLRDLQRRRPGYKLDVHLSSQDGRLTPSELNRLCPDWRERHAFLSGPGELLDALKEHWKQEGDPERMCMERFQPKIGGDEVQPGSGGTVRFRVTDVEAICDGRTPILVGGEQEGALLPFGCRMGVCHTCIGRLAEGRVRDLRTGEVQGERGAMIRTCINCPEGHVEIEL